MTTAAKRLTPEQRRIMAAMAAGARLVGKGYRMDPRRRHWWLQTTSGATSKVSGRTVAVLIDAGHLEPIANDYWALSAAGHAAAHAYPPRGATP